MLWPDDFGWPQDIGALVILEATSLLGPDGRVRIHAVRNAIEARLHLVSRFRQRLYVPRPQRHNHDERHGINQAGRAPSRHDYAGRPLGERRTEG